MALNRCEILVLFLFPDSEWFFFFWHTNCASACCWHLLVSSVSAARRCPTMTNGVAVALSHAIKGLLLEQMFMLKTSNKRKQTKTGYKSSLANWWKKVEDSIHIKKAIVYKQLFEFKSNLDSHMIRNLKSSNSELTRFCARIKKRERDNDYKCSTKERNLN